MLRKPHEPDELRRLMAGRLNIPFKVTRIITLRLTLTIFVAVTLIAGLMLLLNYRASRVIIYNNAEENARNLTRATQGKINSFLTAVEEATENTAIFISSSTIEQNELDNVIKAMLMQDPTIYGSTIAIEPDLSKQEQGLIAPYYYKTDKGLVYVNLATPSYNYPAKKWFRAAKELGRPVWSEPYFDEGGGGTKMTTYAVPFFETAPNGTKRFLGVITADVTLDWLDEIVTLAKTGSSGFGFLLSSNGTFIAHPKRELVMEKTIFQSAAELNNPYLASLGKKMLSGQSGFERYWSASLNKFGYIYYAPLLSNGWALGVVLWDDEIFAGVNRLTHTSLVVGIIGLIFLLAVIAGLAETMTKPLRMLAGATRNIAEGNLDSVIPALKSSDEVGELARAFSKMQVALRQYIKNLTETTVIKERMESELKIARDIQREMLPSSATFAAGRTDFELSAQMAPAREVGGDLYDFFMADSDTLYFCIGDVSGKGIAAALYMAMAKTELRSESLKLAIPGEALTKVNAERCRDNPTNMFVTVFLGVLDLKTGEVRCANAGHNPPVVIPSQGKPWLLEVNHGPPCGLFPHIKYDTTSFQLAANDAIFLYTDGVTEAMNGAGDLYTEERLLSFLTSDKPAGNEAMVQHLFRALETFAAGAEQTDDIAMVSLLYRGQSGPPV